MKHAHRIAALLWMLSMSAWSPFVMAHESQPGLLEMRQLTNEHWEIIWRAPIYYGKPHPAHLVLPTDWQRVGDPTVQHLVDSDLYRQIVALTPGTLDGSVIDFPGLEQTITDVFVRLSRLDGTDSTQVVRPASPRAVLSGERPWSVIALEYIALGFNHILLGIDHLLFVLGLMILVRGQRRLIVTITAFTLAHSITLSLTTLGYANLAAPPIEAAIALSILFLGVEMVRTWHGEGSFTTRRPWAVAFCFGLLHGFGFASGLSIVGMSRDEIPLALAMFNVGVEFGQLAFVVAILLSYRAIRTLAIDWPSWAGLGPAYAIGSLGAYWTIQRTAMMF